MLKAIKPYLRTTKLRLKRLEAKRFASTPVPGEDAPPSPPPGFVVGCGRSGTTILGKILTAHPEVCYLEEPYHFWAAIERRADVTNLHVAVDGVFFMDESFATPEAKVRFHRLIMGAGRRASKPRVIEKTPHNVARLGFLEALAPGSTYLHMVRNGCDVVRSIDRLATNQPYRMAGKPRYNQWWGESNAKWNALSKEGKAHDFYPDEVDRLETNAQRGAYEWLVSLGLADRWAGRLEGRLLERTYSDLTASPRDVLSDICAHFGIGTPDEWMDESCAMLSPERKNAGEPVRLPPSMAAQFNAYQERFGFDGRAETM